MDGLVQGPNVSTGETALNAADVRAAVAKLPFADAPSKPFDAPAVAVDQSSFNQIVREIDSYTLDDVVRIAQINDGLALADGLFGKNIKARVVSVADLVLLEENSNFNARFMRNEVFKNLVNNVAKDGGLTSVPYCWLDPLLPKDKPKYLVLSGNHRTKAARANGMKWALILFNDSALTEQERIAIQLSHNSLSGEDDPVILKSLWDKLGDISLKQYSGLDDKKLEELKKISLKTLSEVNLDFRQVSFLFLPDEIERLDEVFKRALEQTASKELYLARFADFERALAALATTNASFNIRNTSTAFLMILDVFERNITQLAEAWAEQEEVKNRQWVPLATIFGTDRVPVEAAKIIQRAAARMMDSGEVTKKNLFQCVEYWAASYLAEGGK